MDFRYNIHGGEVLHNTYIRLDGPYDGDVLLICGEDTRCVHG